MTVTNVPSDPSFLLRVFAELRSYVDPPKLVLQVVQALHYLLSPDKECETWMQCKQVPSVAKQPILQ